MTPGETIELGHLLERKQRVDEAYASGRSPLPEDVLSNSERARLADLAIRAHLEVPTKPTEIVLAEQRTVFAEEQAERVACLVLEKLLAAGVVALTKL